MEIQEIIIWALILFGAAMIVYGVVDFSKQIKRDKLEYRETEYEDPRILRLIRTQSLVDAFIGVLYVALGVMGIMEMLEVQVVYGLVLAFAIIKKVIDIVIRTTIGRLDDED